VFIYLAIAALAVRVRWNGRASMFATAGAVFLLGLALFWTSVKHDYRDFATGGEDSQALAVPLDQRLGFIGGRAAALGETDWGKAAHVFVNRLAYVDITGSVIAVQQGGDDHAPLRQWGEALSHVFQPRFLFPNKPALSDTAVFIRLTRADATETLRGSTSISVGYMGENYADLGYPGMLAGIFLTGLILGGAIRYFMAAPMPWALREGTVLALIYSVGINGIEASLPKILGAAVMFFLIFALLAKYAYPRGIAWLDMRGRQYAPERAPAAAPTQPADEPKLPFIPAPPDRPLRRAMLVRAAGRSSRPAEDRR